MVQSKKAKYVRKKRYTRMTIHDRVDAVKLSTLGEDKKDIALLFGVSVSTIRNLLTGKHKKLNAQEYSIWESREHEENKRVEAYKIELRTIIIEAEIRQIIPVIKGDQDPYYNP